MTNINPNDGVNKINANIKKESKVNKKKDIVAQSKQVEASALNALNSYGKASINFKGKLRGEVSHETREIIIKKSENFIKNLLNDEEVYRQSEIGILNGELISRIKIGTPVEGINGLYDYSKNHVLICFDKNKEIKQVFKYNSATKEIDVFSKDGELTHHYTKEERNALYYYKYHPDSIHSKLRYGRNMFGGNFLEETNQVINQLEHLFSDESKIFKTTEDKTLYRALQNKLSDEEINQLSTIGATYINKSFCSTSEYLEGAEKYRSGNPVLKINVPKNTKYIDIERLFNIDQEHWTEAEVLLDKNSQFVVKGFDPENNIIEVDLVQ